MQELYDNYDDAKTAADEQGGFVQYVSGRIAPYNVAHMPQVGDEVSMAFNGDYYPMGTITAISKSGEKITTSEGRVFRRPRKLLKDREGREFKQFGWKNGPFQLIAGHHDRRNPSF